ncbi:hypothetical protein lerEdw1_000969 [Lerista edwardsae]|nr:hypothetical protein lerEdw1_000969 [Lerista edwardsae]
MNPIRDAGCTDGHKAAWKGRCIKCINTAFSRHGSLQTMEEEQCPCLGCASFICSLPLHPIFRSAIVYLDLEPEPLGQVDHY